MGWHGGASGHDHAAAEWRLSFGSLRSGGGILHQMYKSSMVISLGILIINAICHGRKRCKTGQSGRIPDGPYVALAWRATGRLDSHYVAATPTLLLAKVALLISRFIL
jgi:hypothetical protein